MRRWWRKRWTFISGRWSVIATTMPLMLFAPVLPEQSRLRRWQNRGRLTYVPLILPLYHADRGIYVDTVLLQEAEASRVFSFAHSYFQVEVDRLTL